MAFWTSAWWVITQFFSLLGYWLSLFFIVPFRNTEVLWILIPIWMNLIFTDFYQEKHGTSIGNAISNGSVLLWVGLDWIRFLTRTSHAWNGIFVLKISLCAIATIAGLLIIIEGIRGKKVAHIIGRVRETSYILLVFSPIIYNLIMPSWSYMIAIILFFPLFYFLFEMIDRMIPDPKAYREEKN